MRRTLFAGALAAYPLLVGCVESALSVPRADDSGASAGDLRLGPAPMEEGWGAPTPEPPGAAEFLFDGTIHRIDLSLPAASRSALSSDPRADVPATLTYADTTWTVGLHLKGSFSFRTLAGKPSFKVDFGEIVPRGRFFGLRRLTLNNMIQDKSMIREHVVYRMYADLGVPAPRHGYAEVWIDGEPYGLYGVLETLDGTWAERVFTRDPEGPIYEGGYGVDLEDGDAYDFHLQRQGALAEPWTDLAALVEELDATPPEARLARYAERFDLPSVLRMWALDLVAGHRDGYVKRKNNFLLYHGLVSDRWWMVPWGQDQSLRDGMEVLDGYSGRVAEDCGEDPACRARLVATIRGVVAAWESWDLAGYATAAATTVAEACARDPRKELPCDTDDVIEMIRERPAEVRAELEAAGW